MGLHMLCKVPLRFFVVVACCTLLQYNECVGGWTIHCTPHSACLSCRQQSINHRWLFSGDWWEYISHTNVWHEFRDIDIVMSGYYKSACLLFAEADFNRNTKRKLQDLLLLLCLLNLSCQICAATSLPGTQHTSTCSAPPLCFLLLSFSPLFHSVSLFSQWICARVSFDICALMLWLEEDSCKLHPGSPNVLSKKRSYWLIVCWEDPFT